MEMFLIIAGLAFLLVIAAFTVSTIVILKSSQRAEAAMFRLLDKRDAEYASLCGHFGDLMDRFYAKQNLAPGGVNLASEHKEQKAKAEIREATKANQPRLRRIGPVDAAQLAMEQSARGGSRALI